MTHPKTVAEKNVTAEDLDDLKRGIAWFIQMTNSFDTAMIERYGKNEP